jgi:dehydrogenase/reductase SDR family member 12
MARIVQDIPSPVPAARAFVFLEDFTGTAAWDPGVVAARRIDAGPVRVGSVFELDFAFGRRTMPLRYTVIEHRAPERLVLEALGAWYRGRDEVTVTDRGDGTATVRWDATFALRGPLALLDPLLARGFDRVAALAVEGLAGALARLAGPQSADDPTTGTAAR